MRRELDVARAKLRGVRLPVTIAREAIEQAVQGAAPPGVPFELRVLRGDELRARFPDGPDVRRSAHLSGRLRLTHRAIPSEAVIAIALYSDVAADYFVETVAADVARALDRAYGDGVALADIADGIPVVLKELAVAAGLGVIGKNGLLFSPRFGFHCKLAAVFVNAPVDRYDATPTNADWRLPDCSTCNLCVEACPVSAFDDYAIHDAPACDRVIATDFFGPRRDHMCRACITRCPVSNDVLKLRRGEGAPQRLFWDNEAQLSLIADLLSYRPSFWVWLLQRFYYGADLPGRPGSRKPAVADIFPGAVNATTTTRSRDGWRRAARAKP